MENVDALLVSFGLIKHGWESILESGIRAGTKLGWKQSHLAKISSWRQYL